MAGFWNKSDEAVEFEGKIEFSTAKAHLVEPTIGEQVWVPKSQLLSMSEPDADGNRTFKVTEWWAKKNGYC